MIVNSCSPTLTFFPSIRLRRAESVVVLNDFENLNEVFQFAAIFGSLKRIVSWDRDSKAKLITLNSTSFFSTPPKKNLIDFSFVTFFINNH